MRKVLALLIVFCFIQNTYTACTDGQFATTLGADTANHGTCTSCLPVCKTCTSATTCTTHISKIKGVDGSGNLYCAYPSGYNSNTDACENCAAGCSACYGDYNICTSCINGWDFDRNGLQCLRATLGLSAVVLALSVLTLIVGVITCILSCKLS